MLGGGLFGRYFLDTGIQALPEWATVDDAAVSAFRSEAGALYATFPTEGTPSEAETEQLLIFPLLKLLGWHLLPQQKTGKRREDIPDALMFATAELQAKALAEAKPEARFRLALVVQESKAWNLGLDRAAGPRTPASQALRYLRLAEERSGGAVRWALLSNGRLWRLYWHDAGAVSEQFLEADLPDLLKWGSDGALRSFLLLFRQQAHALDDDGRSFLLRALDNAREWQERITEGLSAAVFDQVFPDLLAALSQADPAAEPGRPEWSGEVRDGALVLLYRLLFLLYAEDRDLLPREHHAYAPLSLTKTRRELRDMQNEGRVPGAGTQWWRRLAQLIRAVDTGNDRMGLPPYNGGLFAPGRAPLLDRVSLPDAALAPILDRLSVRHVEGEAAHWINYRDLSVQQLGTIYEALLERRMKLLDGVVRPEEDDSLRHAGGAYYTRSAALVRLTLGQAVGPLLTAARNAFAEKAASLKGDRRPAADKRADLARFDAAITMLSLRILDPAMGSGHFLVALVDMLADAILSAMAEAADLGEAFDYASPLAAEIAMERLGIEATAKSRGWEVQPRHLDDRQMVRRLVLKRVVHGVDLNPLAVDLAKVSLWLHSFTVGAPLSFLDHHLRVGDSLFGCWMDDIEALLRGDAKRPGMMSLYAPLSEARGAALAMAGIEKLADADIAQVHESHSLFDELSTKTAPLVAFLDAWHARAWLPPAKGEATKQRKRALDAWLDGSGGMDAVQLAAGAVAKAENPTPAAQAAAAAVNAALAELRGIALSRRFLHWQVAFPNLWTDLSGPGGFDAVVGNPPYVRQEQILPLKPALKSRFPEVFDGVADLYVYFFAQALKLLRPGGRFAYVVNNKWLRAGYAENLRGVLTSDTAWLERITDFGHAKGFFPGVDAFPSVVCVRRPTPDDEPPETAQVTVVPRDLVRMEALEEQVAAAAFPLPRAAFTKESWVLEPPEVRALMDKLRRNGAPLTEYAGVSPMYGVKTGFNDAFVVDQLQRDALVAADPRSEELLKPFLRGQDIDRWASDWAGLWMIFARRGTDIAAYPAIEAHLARFREGLEPKPANWVPNHENDEWPGRKAGSYKWFEIQDEVAYFAAFDMPKIVFQRIAFHSRIATAAPGMFVNDSALILPSIDPWLRAVLSSPCLWWLVSRTFPKKKDEALSFDIEFLRSVPVPLGSPPAQHTAAILTDTLAATTRARHAATRQLRGWYAAQWGIEEPSRVLLAPWKMTAPAYAAALRRALPPARRALSSSETGLIAREHADTIAPIASRLSEAERGEAALSRLVSAAYGLTPKEEALLWETAPPRMPMSAPPALGEGAVPALEGKA